ncbi:MAG: PAS domain-containing sensor histidine kinase [Pseudomonadota bacterium]
MSTADRSYDLPISTQFSCVTVVDFKEFLKSFDMISDIALLILPDGKVIGVNHAGCETLGFKPEELIGNNVSDIELGTSFRDAMADASPYPTRKAVTYETSYERKDSPALPVEAMANPVEIGNESYWLIVARDISKRKRWEEAHRLSIQLARHDLFTSLGLVIGFADDLKEDDNLAAPQKTALELILKAGIHMRNYLNIADKMVEIESKTYRPQAASFDLLEVIDGTISELQTFIKKKGSVIVIRNSSPDVTGNGFTIRGEEALIHVMVCNLLKNAIEAAPSFSKIRVTLEKTCGQQWSMEIHNPGMIPVEVQPCVFEKYTTSGKARGVGLGAYSAHCIACIHGGTIKFITSASHGTTMTVSIPSSQPGNSPHNRDSYVI